MTERLSLLVTRLRLPALAVAVSAGCSAAVAQTADDSWRESAVQTVLEEPSVVEAMFPNDAPSSFWASVRDDGSRRDGLAEYLCLTLYDSGMPAGDFVVVRIWDAAAMAGGELREIGRFDCALE